MTVEPITAYKKQIKDIEKEEERLARKKKDLLEEEKKIQAENAKLDTLIDKSGFKTPKGLVEAIIARYNVKLSPRTKSGATRRKRTKITAQLRDSIKKAVKAGSSMNQVSKDFQISYAVVAKIMKGEYDKLK
ncbi:MAG: hypothetical protein ACFBZ8_13845 [Opitutales bacterium]